MINYPVSEILQKHFLPEFLSELDRVIHTVERPADVSEIAAYLSFICTSFVKPRVELENVCNREFLIHEFFADRYNQIVTLSDLAAELSLSEKQTARLVEKYMGASFSKVLTSYRINAAKLLMQSDRSMTMTEIAAAVGYSSYSGFWKAFKVCNNDAHRDVATTQKHNL
jgi:AraC-like DNA-binding protein